MAVATAPPSSEQSPERPERRIDAARVKNAAIALARTSGRAAGARAPPAVWRACFAALLTPRPPAGPAPAPGATPPLPPPAPDHSRERPDRPGDAAGGPR